MEAAVQKWVDEIKENKWYVVLMGDLMENAIRGSVGSTFEQRYTPADQLEMVAEILEPVRDYILGGIGGNHGRRTVLDAGIDPDELICQHRKLKVPYFGATMAGRLQVGSAHWKVVAHHGAGGGALMGSKLNVVSEKMTKIFPLMDLYLAGHTHADLGGSDIRPELCVSGRGVQINTRIRHFSGTGSLLSYAGSYAENMLLPPASPVQVVHFLGDRIHRGAARKSGGASKYEKAYRREPRWF